MLKTETNNQLMPHQVSAIEDHIRDRSKNYSADAERAFYYTYGKGINPIFYEKALSLLDECMLMFDGDGAYGLEVEIRELLKKVQL